MSVSRASMEDAQVLVNMELSIMRLPDIHWQSTLEEHARFCRCEQCLEAVLHAEHS